MMRIGTIFLLVFFGYSISAQNLEGIGKDKALTVNGSLNLTGIGYHAYGIPLRRDPFNWFLNGGISLSLYGWNVPFSFSYSNQNYSFQQPFNQYGVSPEYKWVRTHFGYRNMNFSRYSLAGHTFLGAGAELTPGKFKFSMMYGRLNRESEGDTLSHRLPVYKRMGYGFMAGYASGQDALDVIYFKAWDDPSSVHTVSEEVRPQENIVLSIIGRKSITERIYISGEYAVSGLARDISLEDGGNENDHGKFDFLFTNETYVSYFDAYNTGATYTGNSYSMNVNFERISPGYTTLGAYFFNNDIQNLTVGGAVQLLKQKLNISGNIGSQKNNLDNTELNDTKRFISSINVNYIPSDKWNINTSFSNFTTFTNIRPQLDPFFQNELDTLNFYQINRSASATVSHSFGEKQNRKSIFFTGTYNVSGDEQEGMMKNSSFINGNLAYRFSISETSISLSANLNKNSMQDFNTLAYGPNASISRTFFNKLLRTSLSATFNEVKTNEILNSRVMNFRLTGGYKAGKQHSINFFINMLRNFGTSQSSEQFNEFTGTINYSFSF